MSKILNPKVMNRDELSMLVAKKIADSLPPEFVSACVEEAIRACITDFKVDDYAVREIMKSVIAEKTKELLKTKFEKQVEAQAEAIAVKALANTSFR
jgi:hypothetical protein